MSLKRLICIIRGHKWAIDCDLGQTLHVPFWVRVRIALLTWKMRIFEPEKYAELVALHKEFADRMNDYYKFLHKVTESEASKSGPLPLEPQSYSLEPPIELTKQMQERHLQHQEQFQAHQAELETLTPIPEDSGPEQQLHQAESLHLKGQLKG